MIEQIQQLIAEGQTEEALELLAKESSDALLLQARFNAGKKQYNMGLIEFSEWQRTQAQINYAALEMAKSAEKSGNKPANGGGGGMAPSPEPQKNAPAAAPSVFISYNHNDAFAMRSVKSYLEGEGIKVFVDVFEMQVGANIQEFIDKALQENTIILSLISKNSLVSGWVSVELSSAMVLKRFGSRWMPARLDDACFDDDFYFDTLSSFEAQLDKKRANIRRALDSKVDPRPFQDELSRLEDLKANFGKIIETLKETLVVDVSEKMFDSGMSKIVQTIRNQ